MTGSFVVCVLVAFLGLKKDLDFSNIKKSALLWFFGMILLIRPVKSIVLKCYDNIY